MSVTPMNIEMQAINPEDNVELINAEVQDAEQNDKDENEFKIGGRVFKGSEIRRVILISEKDSEFNIVNFFKMMFFHSMYMFTSLFVAGPLIMVFTKCNILYLYNLQFIGTGMPVYAQFMFGSMVVGSSYFYYMTYLESQDPYKNVMFNWLDHAHWISQIICRQMIIAVKYGYYSNEHMKILETVRINSHTNTFDLLVASVVDSNLDNLYERLGLIMQFLEINENEFYFDVTNDEIQNR